MSESFLYPYGRYDDPPRADEGPRCEHWSIELGALVTANGTRHICEFCTYCGSKMSGAISNAKLRAQGIDPDALPTVRDQEAPKRPCPVCGRLAHLHVHHWAPKHLFDEFEEIEIDPEIIRSIYPHNPNPEPVYRRVYEYEKWPKSELCPSCHERWHRIVTPNMNRRKAS